MLRKRCVCAAMQLLVTSGCAQSPTGSFTYHATASWYAGTAPQVTTVTIDGQPLASGATYQVMRVFKSYDAAVPEFVPLEVVVTIPAGPQNFMIAPGYCNNLPPDSKDKTFTAENDMYYAMPSAPDGSGIGFYPYCGECTTSSETYGWCARVE